MDDRYSIALSFGAPHCNECFLGVYRYKGEEALPDLPEVRDLLLLGKSSDWYVCWKYFEPRHWQNTASAWTDIHTGKMANAIFGEFDVIHATLKTGGALKLLR